MGKVSQQEIDETIEEGIARGMAEAEIFANVAALQRLSDAELAERGVHALPDRDSPCARQRPSGRGSPLPPPPPGPVVPHGHAKPAPPPNADTSPPLDPPPFATARVRARHDGWTAERQRAFIAALAETACVSQACAEVGLTPRSAYRLREHPAAAGFRAAWGHAEAMASARLVAIAFDRAIHGSVERIYRDGVLVAERRKPSDRLLMWLLSHHDPATYGWLSRPQATAPHGSYHPVSWARAQLPAALEQIVDMSHDDCPAELLFDSDFDHEEPDGPLA